MIPADGDIVLGQEYTDFDKGLEEGVEGSVLGFNLLLASAFDRLDYSEPSLQSTIAAGLPLAELPFAGGVRAEVARRNADRKRTRAAVASIVPMDLAFGPNWSHRISRRDNIVALSSPRLLNILTNDTEGGETPTRGRIIPDYTIGEIANPPEESSDVPLGLQLVKLSYVRCQLGRGSPPISGQTMLISWSRTPVKIFGGAMVKNVDDECGKFRDLN